MRNHLLVTLALLAPRISAAQSPNTDRSFREGANHHIGDDEFIAEQGREPTDADEKLRMHTHFLAAKKLLSSRPATKPELAERRAQILGYFDEYIAKGTTPKNDHLPWRTPVFIDDEKTICAVGYLIERSVGREVAERVAKTHRYSYLEEIAAAMPEVKAWVESSGFTLEELSTIQPGYEGPDVSFQVAWNLVKDKVDDGTYSKDGVEGLITKHRMEGPWTMRDGDGHVIGTGTFKHGAAVWHSSYPDGKPMAEGHYANNQPTGTWKFFHESGRLAAEGELSHGARDGTWHFYYDLEKRTPLATGSFSKGWLGGTWKHFDTKGKLLAVSSDDNRGFKYGGMFRLDIVPGKDGIHHEVHQGNLAGDHRRLDEITSADGKERLYVQLTSEKVYDEHGMQLTHGEDGWIAGDCHWDRAQKRAAMAGEISKVHFLLIEAHREHDDATCDDGAAVSAARSKRIDTMLASVRAVRSVSPDFVRALALGDATAEDLAAVPPKEEGEDGAPSLDRALGVGNVDDLAQVLASNMSWYIEWPHIDRRFVAVYNTLPGLRGRNNG